MTKIKHYLAAGALLGSAVSGLALPAINTFADSPVSHWMVNTGFTDENLFNCVLTAYKRANGVTDADLANTLSVDDPLPTTGLNNITSIYCEESNVTDTSGLQKLPNLTSLDLYGNSISSIDVSQNPKLEVLTVSDNAISSLDVSRLVSLKTLNCGGNPLNELDLRNNTLLVGLDAPNSTLVTTANRAVKTDFGYTFNYGDLGFIYHPDYPSGSLDYVPVTSSDYTINQDTHTINSTSNAFLDEISFTSNLAGNSIRINTRPVRLAAYYFVDSIGKGAIIGASTTLRAGDQWDSDTLLDIVGLDNLKASIEELNGTNLAEVEAYVYGADIANEGVGLDSGSTNTHLYGVVPDVATDRINVIYYFETVAATNDGNESVSVSSAEDSVAVPDTGRFTDTDGDTKAVLPSIAAIAIATTSIFVAAYAVMRHRAKVQFHK